MRKPIVAASPQITGRSADHGIKRGSIVAAAVALMAMYAASILYRLSQSRQVPIPDSAAHLRIHVSASARLVNGPLLVLQNLPERWNEPEKRRRLVSRLMDQR